MSNYQKAYQKTSFRDGELQRIIEHDNRLRQGCNGVRRPKQYRKPPKHNKSFRFHGAKPTKSGKLRSAAAVAVDICDVFNLDLSGIKLD